MGKRITTTIVYFLVIHYAGAADVDTPAGAETSNTDSRGCPKGLTGQVEVYKCHCYQFKTGTTYWKNDVCTSNGGHLAKIESKEVNNFLVEHLETIIPDEKGAWIGASRADEDSPFYWTDGSSVDYTNWADGEPDNLIVIDQDCVYMKSSRNWRWATLQCDASGFGYPIPSVCQYDRANCTLSDYDESTEDGTVFLVGIIVGAVLGFIALVLVVACIIYKCTSVCKEQRKKRQQQRSVRYYSRPPSGTRQQFVDPSCDIVDGAQENDLNERLVRGAEAADDDSILNVKGSTLPTASSIAAEAAERQGLTMDDDDDDDDSILNVKGGTLPTASSIAAEAAERQGLVVDMNTGKSTVKRINGPSPSRADNASTRTLKSFQMDASDRVSRDPTPVQLSGDESKSINISVEEGISSDDDKSAMMANLDNIDKPSSHSAKNIDYK